MDRRRERESARGESKGRKGQERHERARKERGERRELSSANRYLEGFSSFWSLVSTLPLLIKKGFFILRAAPTGRRRGCSHVWPVHARGVGFAEPGYLFGFPLGPVQMRGVAEGAPARGN